MPYEYEKASHDKVYIYTYEALCNQHHVIVFTKANNLVTKTICYKMTERQNDGHM